MATIRTTRFILGPCNKSTRPQSAQPDVFIGFFGLILVFNATFSNISAISWRPGLVVEETIVPGVNHQPWESN